MSYRIPLAFSAAFLAAGLGVIAEGQEPTQPNAEAQGTKKTRPRIRFGGFSVNAGYTHMSGPSFYPYSLYRPWMWGPYSWNWPYMYDPFIYGPYLHPGFFTGFGYYPSMGEVKLRTEDKDAWVYLDGALAGKADKLKNMWLEPGAYNLEVRSGQKRFGQKVYILSGKTLRLTADLERGEVRP